MDQSRRSRPHALPDRPSSPMGRAVAVASVCVLATAMGASPPGTDEAPHKAETLVLFDGKSLDGWKVTGFANAGKVTVEGGTIVLGKGRSMTGVTSTRRDLPRTDYELTYEAMRTDGSDFFAAATFPVGKSYLTLVNGGWGGNVTGLSSLDGSDASENETGTFVKYRDKTWYRFRVRVTDVAVVCRVDDKEVVAVAIRGRDVDTRVESHASKPLGFATWETGGVVRGIEVRKLTPAEVAEVAKAVGPESGG